MSEGVPIFCTALARGAFYKMTEGNRSEPYEINCAWWNAINGDPSGKEDLLFQVKRYMASRSLVLTLSGVPGLYIHGILGTPNDYQRAHTVVTGLGL